LVAASVERVLGSRALAAGGVTVAALIVLTFRQAAAYRDVETLWRDTLAKNPRSVLALQNLGTIEYGRGRLSDALALWERARDVEPERPDVWNSIGLAQARLGRTD